MGRRLLMVSGMKTYTHLQIVSLGFVLFCSVVSEARGGAGKDLAESVNRPPAIDESLAGANDPLADWVEKNANRLGLYMDEKDRSVAPTPVKVKSNTVKRSDGDITIQPGELGPLPVVINNDFDAIEGLYLKDQKLGVKIEKRTSEPTDVLPITAKEAASQINKSLEAVLGTRSVCDDFVTEDGFGPYGKLAIREVLKSENRDLLDGPVDVRSENLCPNFAKLGPAKVYFWVFVKTAMAFLEGSCDPLSGSGKVAIVNGKRRVYPKHKGPNGFATGLFALHEGKEDQYGAPNCEKNDAKSGARSVICAVSMLSEQVKRRFKLFTNDAHFGVLVPKGDTVTMKNGSKKRVQIAKGIVAGIRMLPFCGYVPPSQRLRTASQGNEGNAVSTVGARTSGYTTIR